MRLIVTSRSYRQQSASRPELAEIDPANRLLAGQSARRLDAEFVRDNALAISGLLAAGHAHAGPREALDHLADAGVLAAHDLHVGHP